MNYLMWQLWLCLLIALLLGVALGWLLRGGCKKKISNIVDDWSQRFELVEEERDLFAVKAQDSSRLTHENKSLLGRLSSMESGANLASDVLNENKSRLDKTDLKLSNMESLLEQRDFELGALQERLSKANNTDNKAASKSLASDVNDADAGLRVELQSKTDELEVLTKDYQVAKEDAETMRTQLDEYEKTNRELLDKEGETGKALSVAEKINIENKKKSAETQSQLEITDQKNQELNKDLGDLSEKLALADKRSADDARQIEEVTSLYDQNIANSRTFKSQIMQSGNDLRADLSHKKVLCENLELDIQSIKEEAKANADQVISVQELLKTKEKENDELISTEQQLQMALSTAENSRSQHEEEIAEYQAEKEQLTNELHASKEKELAGGNELEVMQGLLVAHEKGNQDLVDKESQLEEELSTLKAEKLESKDVISKYESKLEKLNNELDASKEKGLADTDELKVMQGLLVTHEKGNQDLLNKESQLEEELSKLKAEKLENKKVISKYESKLEKLNNELDASKEKGLADTDELKMMQGLLVAHEKGSQDLSSKESQLEEELSSLKARELENKGVISKYESKLEKLNNELDASKEKGLTDTDELKMTQNLLVAHEKGNQDLVDKESLLEEELSALKAEKLESKDVISKYESKLEKLNNELDASKEKGLTDADELKMMQGLLVAHEKGNQDFLDKENQLQKALSDLEAEETKKKQKVSQNSAEIKTLKESLQVSSKKEQSARDEIEMMQALVEVHKKGKQDLVEKEEELQQALSIAEKTADKYKDELERKNKETQQAKLDFNKTRGQLKAQNTQVGQIKSLIHTYEKNAADMLDKQSLLKTKSSGYKQENKQLKNILKNKDKQIQSLQSTYDNASSDMVASKALINKKLQGTKPVDHSQTINKSTVSYNIEEIDGIGKGFGKRLRKIGIHTTTDLLEKCQDDNSYAKHIAKAMSQNEKTVETWLEMADLLRIDGIDGKYAELLYLSGVNSSAELAASDMSKVRSKIKNVVKNQHHAKKTPAEKMISKWIALAKKLTG